MKKTLLTMLMLGSVIAAGAQGTKDAPLSVDQILEKGVPETAVPDTYVQGYIVGWVDGQAIDTNSKFTVPASSTTNLLLAASSSETNPSYCIPVQLPSGDIRNALNLSMHPENLGHEVVLGGSNEKYFRVSGLKNTFYYAWVGDAPVSDYKQPASSEAAPLSVTAYLESGIPPQAQADVWVKGYIVGYVPAAAINDAIFGNTAPEAQGGEDPVTVSKSNLLIAASADCRTVGECIPVALPVGAIRDGLNLNENPANLGKEVVLCGSHELYFNVNGLKEVNTYILDGNKVTTVVEGKTAKSVAETIALAAKTPVTVDYPLTVAFVNGRNVFACDAAGDFIQVFGTNSYKANDIIPAGWNATYDLYHDTPELIPVGDAPAASGEGKFSPKFVDGSEISNALVNNVVIIKNVTFATATPDAKENFEGEADGVKLSFRNNYTKPGVPAGTYHVEVVVTIYNNEPSLYVINFFDPSGVKEISASELGVYALNGSIVAPEGARVFNLSGVETGADNLPAGIYVVVVADKAVKVAVK